MSRLSSALVLALAAVSTACAPEAGEAELRQMCEHLAELRGEAADEAATKRCVDEARVEGVSLRQARCRIFAVNTQEYWTRCRTGEARAL